MAETKCGFNDGDAGSGSNLLTFYGPTLDVDIGFDPTFDFHSIPIPGVSGISALVDTGASESCIDNILAANLNLPIVDRRRISGASGSNFTNMYLAQVHISSLKYTIYGVFAGVDLNAGGQAHSALIGRTFLQNFHMIYEGNTGTVTLSQVVT